MTSKKLGLCIIDSLSSYIKSSNYRGFDPYDGLNFTNSSNIQSKYTRLLINQLFVYFPINFRSLIGIKKGLNPKALGLILKSLCKQHKLGLIKYNHFKKEVDIISRLLLHNRSEGQRLSWGYNFDWQSINRFLKRNTPTVVNSGFVADAFVDIFDITKDYRFLKLAKNVCEFIVNDLNTLETSEGICFSYTPIDNYYVHNANTIAASLLARVSKRTNEEKYYEISQKAFGFTVSNQLENGMWYYSFDPKTGYGRKQLDWHQGFVINSLIDYENDFDSELYHVAKERALKFYSEKQFDSLGRSFWRYPRRWPIDIHNQAQGIITFSRASLSNKSYMIIAEKILDWTIKNMWENDNFIYQYWPFGKNKINYLRWSQVWMFLAILEFEYMKFRTLKS